MSVAFTEPQPYDLHVAHEAAMTAFAAQIARALEPELALGMTIDLRGALGVGKTTFVRALARALGLPDSTPVVSPTFTIARLYRWPGPEDAARELAHVDAYRLGGPDELESAGFEEMCGTGILTCVEWGGRVEEGLPADRLEITIQMDTAAMLAPPEPGGIPTCPRQVRVRARGPRAAAAVARLWSAADPRGARDA